MGYEIDPNDPVSTGNFGNLYTSDAAPKDPIPTAVDKIAEDLARLSQIATSGGTDPGPQGTATPPSGAPGAGTSQGSGSSAAPANPNSAAQGVPPQQQTALLERLKPIGITDLKQLKGKTDKELLKIAGDVARYEIKQQTLGKYFWKNADGTWDFSKTPDGRPTGLGPDGKPLPAKPVDPPKTTPPAAPPTSAPAKQGGKPSGSSSTGSSAARSGAGASAAKQSGGAPASQKPAASQPARSSTGPETKKKATTTVTAKPATTTTTKPRSSTTRTARRPSTTVRRPAPKPTTSGTGTTGRVARPD